MWITTLDDDQAIEHFGDLGPTIVRACRDALASEAPQYVPEGADPAWAAQCRWSYGPNGLAVHLLIESWRDVPWRAHEGAPTTADDRLTRVHHWSAALEAGNTPTWTRAFEAAGLRAEWPPLRRAWDEAGRVGSDVGSHHARHLASAMAGEMAQLQPQSPTLFLSLFCWVRAGHWPCGWDEAQRRPVIF